jgi:hypothetical protein
MNAEREKKLGLMTFTVRWGAFAGGDARTPNRLARLGHSNSQPA